MEFEDFWRDKYPLNIMRNIENQYASLIDVFKEACCKYAHKPAFSDEFKTLSFADLDKYSACFAVWLQRHTDLKVGDRIAIQLPNILQYPIAIFGAMRAGLIVVNSSTFYTRSEMEHQFKDSGCKAILTLASMGHLIQELLPQTGIRYVITTEIGDLLAFPKRLLVNHIDKYIKKNVPSYHLPDAISFVDILRSNPTKLKELTVTGEDIAILQYTGGTTGVAKGAMLSHNNISSNMLQSYAFLSSTLHIGRETILCPLPLSHVFALSVICVGMMLGAHSVLVSKPREISTLLKQFKSYPVTVLMGANSLFVDLINQPQLNHVDFSKLKLTITGSMPIQPQVAEVWHKITDCPICEGYGMSESSPVITMNPPQAIQIGTIGLPVPNTQLRLVNDDGADVPVGEAGELWVKGPQVMKGYWRNAEATADTLTYDGWLKTGDIALVQTDGYLKIIDRKKDMILVSGLNVYPREIEQVAMTYGGVLDCAAVGVKDFKMGEVVRLFVVKKDPYLSEDEVIEYLQQHLAAHKIPRSVLFVEAIPRSTLGKILRRQLKDWA